MYRHAGDKYTCYMPDTFDDDMDKIMKCQSILDEIALQEAHRLYPPSNSLLDERIIGIVKFILELEGLGELFLNKE